MNRLEELKSLSELLEDSIRHKTLENDKLNNHHTGIRKLLSSQSDMAIRKLLLELETGGNVRFEDEDQGDSW